MRQTELLSGFLSVGVRGFKKRKRMALLLLILPSCLIISSSLRAFIRPADVTSSASGLPLSALYGDDQAYYCIHYGLQGSSVAALCQAPAMVADLAVAVPSNVVLASSNGCYEYDSLFKQYTWNIAIAEAICQAESGGDSYAVSSTDDYGLMQLHGMAIFDPAQNIAIAYRKYLAQGWSAWTTYNTGKYLQFL